MLRPRSGVLEAKVTVAIVAVAGIAAKINQICSVDWQWAVSYNQ